MPENHVAPSGTPNSGANTTRELILRAQGGDDRALNRLLDRYIPRVTTWARGRIPARARDVMDTGDVVQEVLIRTIRRLHAIDPEIQGGFQAYVRRGVLNAIRNQIDKTSRRPGRVPLEPAQPDPGPTPLEATLGKEAFERYEDALARLRPAEREAILCKVELGMSSAEALGKPSPDAARVSIARALVRLAEEMRDGANTSG